MKTKIKAKVKEKGGRVKLRKKERNYKKEKKEKRNAH